jgi:hypothetical protein
MSARRTPPPVMVTPRPFESPPRLSGTAPRAWAVPCPTCRLPQLVVYDAACRFVRLASTGRGPLGPGWPEHDPIPSRSTRSHR